MRHTITMKKAVFLKFIILCLATPSSAQRIIHSNIGSFGGSSKINGYYTVSFNSVLSNNFSGIQSDKSILVRPFNFSNSINEREIVKVNAFPNPTSDKLFLVTNAESISYKIYNISGALCLSGESKEINLIDQSSGVYLLNIYSNLQLVQSQKIILQK
jgi:hypothetical protein